MVELHKSLICSKHINTHHTVTIPTKDGAFAASDSIVLVRWKGEFHWRSASLIGDGMELVRVFERPFLSYELDEKACGEWLTLYREFDEEQWSMRSYLYGFWIDPDEMAAINTILDSLWSNLILARSWKFVECLGHENLEHACTIVRLWWWRVLYSFVFGLFLGYGSLVGDETMIHHAAIEVPMVWSIPQCEEIYKKVIAALKDHWVFLRSSYGTHRSHQTWEIGVYDWEMLAHFHKWMKEYN